MRIMSSMMKDFEDKKFYDSLDLKNRQNILHCRFLFSLMWGLGGSLTVTNKDNGRRRFDLFVKRLSALEVQTEIPEGITPKKLSNCLPDRGTGFDYNYRMKPSGQEGEWILWTDLIETSELEDIQKSKTP